MTEYPFKVSYGLRPHHFLNNQANMREWCSQNIASYNWYYTAWTFEFRRKQDCMQFLLTWT